MKKMIAGLSGLFIFSMAFCQEIVRFSMGFMPNKSYDQILVQKTKIEFSMDTNSNNASMHSNVSKFPATKELEMRLEFITKTGAMNNPTGKMPVTMTIADGDSNTLRLLKPGTKFIGRAALNELPVYDSISDISMDQKQKMLMMKVFSNFTKISMLPGNLKPGQSDTVRTTLDNPIGGGGQMDFISIFYLKSIQGSTAYFDIKVDIHFNIDMKNKPIPGNGSGSGLMEYDIKNHYPSKYNQNYQMNMNFTSNGHSAGMKMSIDMKTTCKVQSL
jgi:hypothetical protein